MRVLSAIVFAGAAAAALIVNVTPSRAASHDNAVLSYFTVENVREILTGLGATVGETRTGETGTTEEGFEYILKYMRFTHRNRKYTATLTCLMGKVDKCNGLLMVSTFTGGTYSLEAVNAFNNRRQGGKASVGSFNNEPLLISLRYIFPDGGITRRHVNVEFHTFFAMTDLLLKDLRLSNVIAKADTHVHSVSYRKAPAAGTSAPHADLPLVIDGTYANVLKN